MTRTSQTRYLKIHDEVWKALKEYAGEDNRTVTNLVQKILGEWVEKYKTLEGGLKRCSRCNAPMESGTHIWICTNTKCSYEERK